MSGLVLSIRHEYGNSELGPMVKISLNLEGIDQLFPDFGRSAEVFK